MDIFDILLQDLKALFEVREFIDGKVELQKSLYFMKELGYPIPFNFRWNKLGPYSYELANIIDRLTVQGYLDYTGRYELNKNYFRFVTSNVTPKMKTFFNAMERICNMNKFSSVDFIECAASLHFIYKYTSVRQKEKTLEKLAILKPDRIQSFIPIEDNAWDFLKGQGLVA